MSDSDKIEELLVLLRLALIRLEEYGDQEVAPLLRESLEDDRGE